MAYRRPETERTPLRVVSCGGSVMHFHCPTCDDEALLIGVPAFDRRVSCTVCSASAEVRIAHEAWCAPRRAGLVLRFPELRLHEHDSPDLWQ